MAARVLKFHREARDKICTGVDKLALGIIDPTKVTRLGLQNAASIASLILTTDCIIVEAPSRRLPHAEGTPTEA